ncbi:MAG: HAMP domain-containing histidine kinase, partial [Clostridia bacterium]|nr:HAMP domain-containing histidine kinase [Clostridia bacterium]
FRFNLNSAFNVVFDRGKVSLFIKNNGADRPEILKQGKNYVITLSNLRNLNSQAIELYAVTEENHFIFIQSSVAPIAESVSFSNRFLITTGLFIWLISALVVTFLSRRLLSPLQRLTNIAGNMANMDFSQKYSGKTFDEVGTLGDSMNKMSENLEKTIADLKSANATLLSDIDKKEKIDKQRKDFLSNVSHELKTPISIIEAYAEGLCEMELSEEDRAYYCEVILDETQKMNVLIKKLMSLMRLESGSTVLDITRFDVSEQIEEIIKQKSILLEQNNVSLSFENVEPAFVWADEFLIEEVFLNYLTNAIKYCSGDKKITVSVEKNEDAVRVNIFNTGENIPEDILEDIWKSFYTGDKARTRDKVGTGLGLSIVSAIMSAHNQKYGVYNTEGGVVFFFELDSKNE